MSFLISVACQIQLENAASIIIIICLLQTQ